MKKITLLFLMFFGGLMYGQLSVSNVETTVQLVQNRLIGAGVVPTSITSYGVPGNLISQQAGYYTTNFNPTNLGLSSGVIMSTGKVTAAPGPNVANGTTTTPSNTSIGDADLQLLTTQTVKNVMVIEFDFVATGLELSFDYVFASEEYPEFVNSNFNDVFGFFLSGPGLAGPFSGNAQNIALVPNTNIPITINSVNNGFNNSGVSPQNSQYYVNNSNIGLNPSTFTGPTVTYDGFTKVLTAKATLQCGGNYHIKLAIGNVSDNQFDSAVFLNNFSIKPLVLLDNQNFAQNTGVCYGETVTISSGIPQGTNSFIWTKDGVVITEDVGTPPVAVPVNTPSLVVTNATPPLPSPPNPFGLSTTPSVYALVVKTDYGCTIAQDDITLAYLPEIPVGNPVDVNNCTLLPPPYTFNIDQTAAMIGSLNPADYIITYYNSSLADAENGVPTGIIADADLGSYTIAGNSATIWVRIDDLLSASGCVVVKPFTISSSPSPSGTIAYPNSPYCKGINTLQSVTATVTAGGVYSATPSGLNIDPTTGAVNPSLSTAGNYTVHYTLAASGNCPAFSPPPATVVINAVPLAPLVSSPSPYCQNTTALVLTATGTNLLWYSAASGGTGSVTAPIPSTATTGNTTYYVSQTVNGCESQRASIVVQVNAIPAAPGVASVPVTYCQNSAATALTATGSGLLWYSAATGGTGNATAPIPSTTTAGNTNYYVSQTASGCESSRSAITVTVYATPALPTVSAVPINYCKSETAVPLIATGSNLLWYTAATGGVGNATIPTPNTATVGSTTYYVSQTINGCEGPRASIVVNVNAIPSAPVVTTPLTYCQNVTAPALTSTGSGLLWYSAASGGVGNLTAPVPNTSVPGTTTYYVSQSNGGCESPRSAIVVNVNATPLAPITAPLTYCQNVSSLALTATGSNLLWYSTATGGTGNAIAPVPSTATAGNTSYYVSQTTSGCESARSAITVTVYATPLLPTVTSPIGYCKDAIANPLNATGSNLSWYTAATGGSANPTAPTPNTATVGNTTYYVSQTINGCEGPRASIVVNVNTVPLAPLVTTPLTYCQNESGVPALTAAGSALLWYSAATGGTGNTTAPVPNTSVPGTTTYYVSQTNGGCESPRSAISVNVNAAPSAPGVLPLNYCQNTTALRLTATGTNLLWYAAATGGSGNATAPSPQTASPGVTNYYVTQTVSGCESARSALAVTIYATPLLPITSTVNYCQDSSAAPLTATGFNLLWYTVAAGGTGTATAPIPNTATAGSTIYYVSQTINGCEGPRASITVNVSPTPAAPLANSPIVYCQNVNPTALTATGNNLRWYVAATGGMGNTVAPTPTTVTAGNTIYYVSQTNNGCESPRTPITVTILPLPTAPLIPASQITTYCQNTTATALTATGTNLLWYANATGGVGNSSAPTPSTTTPGVTTYYVSQTTNGCEGPRVGIPVTVYATPAFPTISNTTIGYCQNAIAVSLTATGSSLLWYTSATGGSGNTIAPIPSTTASGNTVYYVSQTISGCEGPRASIVVTITPTPTAPSATASIVYCQNTTASALTASGVNLLWYGSATGGTGNSIAPIPDTSVPGTTNYYVSQSTNGCESPRSQISVKVNAAPVPTLIAGSICVDENNIVIAPYRLDSGLDISLYSFEWFHITGTSAAPIANASLSAYSANVGGRYGVRATNRITGCVSDIISVNVSIAPAPTQINVVASEYFADDQRITVNVFPSGNYQYQLDNGAFQSLNIFVDVPPGSHIVTVKSECGQYPRTVYLMDFPRFFTPNGDGYNDTWNIFSLSGQAKAKIYIFDRFGKLMKEISPSGLGWDGTFNHQQMPSTDYWFIVNYEDENHVGKEFKSHFALKR